MASERQCFYCKQSLQSAAFRSHLRQCPQRLKKTNPPGPLQQKPSLPYSVGGYDMNMGGGMMGMNPMNNRYMKRQPNMRQPNNRYMNRSKYGIAPDLSKYSTARKAMPDYQQKQKYESIKYGSNTSKPVKPKSPTTKKYNIRHKMHRSPIRNHNRSPTPTSAQHQQLRRCRMCSLHNSPNAKVCTMCQQGEKSEANSNVQRSIQPPIGNPYYMQQILNSMQNMNVNSGNDGGGLPAPNMNMNMNNNRNNNNNSGKDAYWECQSCTFVNSIMSASCKLCSNPQPKGQNKKNNNSTNNNQKLEWQCTVCTYKNPPNVSKCAMCNEPKSNSKSNPYISGPLNDFDCPICLESKSAECKHIISSCGHQFCRDCLRGHILNYSKPQLPDCPLPNCDAQMADHIDIQVLVTETEYIQLHEKIDKVGISKLANLKQCLTPDCQYAMELIVGTKFDCPVCKKHWCTKCQIKWHDGMSCKEYKKSLRQERISRNARQMDRQYNDWKENQGSHVKQCPKCHNHIQKNGGCNHMTCRCGTHWCWVCNAILNPNNLEAHFSENHPMIIYEE